MAAMTLPDDTLLRRALRGNSLFSGVTGALALVDAPLIASILGVENLTPFIAILGLGLLAYAALLAWQTSRETLDRGFAVMAIVLDVLWVVGSFALVFASIVPFSDGGKWAVIIVADVVAVFALLQFIGFRKLQD